MTTYREMTPSSLVYLWGLLFMLFLWPQIQAKILFSQCALVHTLIPYSVRGGVIIYNISRNWVKRKTNYNNMNREPAGPREGNNMSLKCLVLSRPQIYMNSDGLILCCAVALGKWKCENCTIMRGLNLHFQSNKKKQCDSWDSCHLCEASHLWEEKTIAAEGRK